MKIMNMQIDIGNKLPTVYDVALNIHSYSTQPESKKMVEVMNMYDVALVNTWEKSFGSNHVISVAEVKGKQKKVVND